MLKNIIHILIFSCMFPYVAYGQKSYPIDEFNDGIHHWNLEHKNRDYRRYTESQYIEIADNLIAYQNEDGGWMKNIDWLAVLNTDSVKQSLSNRHRESTLDNKNTYAQIEYLSNVYTETKDEKYKQSILKGLNYLLDMQKSNGGWRGWDVDAVTFNDDVTTGALELFGKIVQGDKRFSWIVDPLRNRIRDGYERGLKLILNCQIMQNGLKTAWAQQYDNQTLEPVKARTYELPAISASESSKIVDFLMNIDHPSPEITEAINAAVAWFDKVKIKGIRIEKIALPEDKIINHEYPYDKVVVKDSTAQPIWARYYELSDNTPFFATRQGQKVWKLEDVNPERRTGYAWYGYWPQTILNRHHNPETKNYIRMANSEIKRNPEAWMLDFSVAPKWNYCHGLVLMAIQKVYQKTGDKKYYDYVKNYADTMLLENGNKILTYKPENYNIDHINPGKILFSLYKETQDEKYKNALMLLRKQMLTHPRTSEGGFWHKKVYPHQMWLDGLYMASPFLAEYARRFNEPELFDDVARQITLIAQHSYSKETGLYFHGWDESRKQKWANPDTGLSPNFWSRSIGWYMMAMVDALEFFPQDHPKRVEIINILSRLSASLEKFRDPETGMWYQVTDKIKADGNYLESTGSIMFIYTWIKGAKKGYLDASYLEKGKEAYKQFVKQFVITEADGTMSVTNCCAVAGLGGKENRDGSYTYYISEPIRNNDPKATGTFILTGLLLNK